MGKTLIQPMTETLPEYHQLAEREGFGFEIVDFAFPQNLTGDYEALVAQYLAYEKPERLISMHGAFFDLYLNSPDPDIRAIAVQRYTTNLDIARRLNLQYVIFHTNCLPMIGYEGYYANWIHAQSEFWNATLEQYPLTVLIENMWDASPDRLLELIGSIKSGRLKLCFDTGHWNCFSAVPMQEWFQKLGEHMLYIHVNDNAGKVDDESALGQGSIDWRLFDRLVRDYCDAPYVVLELSQKERLLASIDYMKAHHIYPFG